MIFFALFVIYIINFLKKNDLIKLLILIISLAILEIICFIVIEKFNSFSGLDIYSIFIRSNTMTLVLPFFELLKSFDLLFYTKSEITEIEYSFFDLGRIDQIHLLRYYFFDTSIISNFLGKLTGFHRFGLENYISQDSGGVLRPIGIVTLIIDWGYLILMVITLQYINIILKF